MQITTVTPHKGYEHHMTTFQYAWTVHLVITCMLPRPGFVVRMRAQWISSVLCRSLFTKRAF